MKTDLWILYSRLLHLISEQHGQDLVEYALVVALIALGATAGLSTLASDVNKAFTNIGTSLTSLI
jgi:pilus assembly protein Flp/PilA